MTDKTGPAHPACAASPNVAAPRGEFSTSVVAVLAVKKLADAKSRLTPPPLPRGAHHRSLVLAMLLDTIETVHAAGVAEVVVVSPDDTVLDAVVRAGCNVVREQPSVSVPEGLNRAMKVGIEMAGRRLRGRGRILLIQADLPAARAESVREVLAESRAHRQAFVADSTGRGTVLVIRDADVAAPTLFGAESARAHRSAGVVELEPAGRRWQGLRTDVDTVTDLQTVLHLGVGRHTAAVTADTGLARSDLAGRQGAPGIDAS